MMKDSIPATTAVSREDSASDNSSAQTGAIYWLWVLTAVLLTRYSWAPSYLWTDNVNLAYALEHFDPQQHQPQPPGYPLFVAVARLVRLFSPTNGVAFWFISVAVTVASAFVLYMLGKRMATRWVGLAAVLLFLLNPVFWFSRLHSPLRPWLALFSLLVAYCAWRCWNGERPFASWGAVVLGIGAGFRPDLLAYLLPLWITSAWMATRSWKAVAKKSLIVVGLSAVWAGVVIYAMGGIAATAETITSYLREQSREDSILFAESIRIWLRPISRLVVWNALALVGWIWAPLIGLGRVSSAKTLHWPFLLVWVVPGLISQLLVHIASPEHTLFATPVWCLMGACMIFALGRYRDSILAVAITVNAALFLNFVPQGYPPPSEASPLEKAWISTRNAIAYGTFETSQERLRWWEEMTEVSIQELWKFNAADRPTSIVALNGNDKEFDFIAWRVVSYYLDKPLWVAMDNYPPGHAGRIRLVHGKNVQFAGRATIPLPRSGRVLWIMLPNGRFHQSLERVIPVHFGRYIAYSDIPADAVPFEIEGFMFVPE